MAPDELELILQEAARSGAPLTFTRGRLRVTITVEELQSWELESDAEPDPQDWRTHPLAGAHPLGNRARLAGR